MKWEKMGLIFNDIPGQNWWQSHTLAPTPLVLANGLIRVFAGARDAQGISRITFVDLDPDRGLKPIYRHNAPVLNIGRPGTFDDNGVMPASVFRKDGQLYFYYTGFQLGTKVEYFMFGGLAVSDDDGLTFRRVSEAPILDRSDEGLTTRSGSTVLPWGSAYRMWYSSGSNWVECNGKQRPCYELFHTDTVDAIETSRSGMKAVSADPTIEHGLGRPQAVHIGSTYYLFYTRRTLNYKYSFGFASSPNGEIWTRHDDEIGITHGKDSWDSEMIYFPNIIRREDETFLIYNGNNYGERGFGAARLLSW